MLYRVPVTPEMAELPSPDQLRHKIIIKAKKFVRPEASVTAADSNNKVAAAAATAGDDQRRQIEQSAEDQVDGCCISRALQVIDAS